MDTEELNYENQRKDSLTDVNMYPHSFPTTSTVEKLVKQYVHLTDEENVHYHNSIYSIMGRVLEKRNLSKKLIFYTLSSNGYVIQIISNSSEYGPDFILENSRINRGDIIGVNGYIGTSKSRELSIYATRITLLAPCFKFLPRDFLDMDQRYRRRHLDLIVNRDNINVLKTRSRIISEIRKFFECKEYIELDTPILSLQAGGATARPFVTHHNSLNRDMYLRIAPELWLKQLLVGGLERVFEIGPQFRNEDIDASHLPVFMSLEAYSIGNDYNDMFELCEKLLANVCFKIHNSFTLSYNGLTINFQPPFQRLSIVQELEKVGIIFPDSLEGEEARNYFDSVLKERNIECSNPRTTSRLIDKLISHYLEPKCINPTFLCDHPAIMSPLAKPNRNDHRLVERFELFIAGFELANSYTELNDPFIQMNNFQKQQADKLSGDNEIPDGDELFIDALKTGLAPCAGFGLGIERLIMLLTNRNMIREVVTFAPHT